MHALRPLPEPAPQGAPRAPAPAGARPEAGPSRVPLTRRLRHGWPLEIVLVLGIYELYDWLRDQVQGPQHLAFEHAKQLVHIERLTGTYVEHAIQQFFLKFHWFISFENIWYGSIHFVMPVVVLVWLYRRAPARYVRWRNVLFVVFGLGLLGFWLYPAMPPRLMPARYGFVDTAVKYFGLGKPAPSNNKDAYGNLYAAVPSLHLGWSSWCTFALYPQLRRWWSRALLIAYPFTITLAIVVTGNHWILDAVAGVVATIVAYVIVRGFELLAQTARAVWVRPLVGDASGTSRPRPNMACQRGR
jgi:hypothetical protein